MQLHAFINLHVYLTFIRVWFLTSWDRPTNVILVEVLVNKRVSYLQLMFRIHHYVVCICLVKNEPSLCLLGKHCSMLVYYLYDYT